MCCKIFTIKMRQNLKPFGLMLDLYFILSKFKTNSVYYSIPLRVLWQNLQIFTPTMTETEAPPQLCFDVQ